MSSTKKLRHANNLPRQTSTKFTRNLVNDATLASNDFREKHFDLEKAKSRCIEDLSALDSSDALQAMLKAQMLSIHRLQQTSMTYAHSAHNLPLEQYYTNTAIKLSNCFVQQASLLAKFQGIAGQKIVVEHVEVHSGAHAIVGNIQGASMANKLKK